MATNTLADKTIKAAIKAATEAGKVQALSDGGGLSLLVQPSGAAWWRLRYWLAGKENRLSLGTYPAVSLADARKRRDDARALIAAGSDPSDQRKATKATLFNAQKAATLAAAGEPMPGTFEAVAREWLRLVHEPAVSARYALRSRVQLERDVIPWIGALPAGEVTARMVLDLLRKVEARDALDTAHRVKQTVGLVMRYAIATGHAERDPTPDLREALPTPIKRHYSAILDPHRVGELLRAIDGYEGQPATRAALQLAALVFQRPGNVRAMQWAHIDLDSATWSIPAAEMKRTKQDKETGAAHLVPLASQAVAILRELQPLTGSGALCFPGLRSRDRPISDMTLNAAMRRLGFGADEMTAHGFRAMARTVIREQLPSIDPEWIEAQLAHGKKGPLGAAYDRAQYMVQRRQMMQAWADFLDKLRVGAQVLPFKAA
jgi:integrase